MPQVPDTGLLDQDTDATSPWVLDSELDALALPSASEISDLRVSQEAPININHAEYGGSLDAAVDVVNAAPGTGGFAVYVPAGITDLAEEAGVTVTKADVTLFGDGANSVLENSGAAPKFITLEGRRNAIRGLRLVATNGTAPSTGAAITVDHLDCSISNVQMEDVAKVLKQGVTTSGGRLHVIDVRATISDNSAVDWWEITGGAGSKYVACHSTGGTPGTNAGAYVKLGGGDVAPPDGLQFVAFVCFCNPGGGGTSGIGYAVDIDGTGLGVNNVRFVSCGFDGSDTAAIRYRGDSAEEDNRYITFTRCRFETASGQLIDFDHAGTGSNGMRAFNVEGCALFYANDPATTEVPIVMTGTKAKGIRLVNNDFLAMGDNDLPALMRMGVGSWSAIGNSVMPNSDGVGSIGLDYIYQTTTTDPDDFLVDGTTYEATNKGHFKHFAYTAHHGARYRVLDGPGGAPIIKRGDESVNNSTTLQNDDDLKFQIGENERWYFDLNLDVTGVSTAADIKCSWSVPSGGSYKWQNSTVFAGVAFGSSPTALDAAGNISRGLDNLETAINFKGWITSGATAGTANFQWAQLAAVAENVTVKAGSILRITQSPYG